MSTSPSSPPGPDLSTSRDFERVLFVHAHPDDESIVTGGSIATLVRAGAGVTVLTCTRGELGEVLPDDLAGLRGDPAALAVHREGEIEQAMHALGVSDHRFLGDDRARTPGLPARVYRDSGMEWGPEGTAVPVADLHPAAFCAAEFGEIVSDIAAVVADVRPDALVSYDTDGGYGHPDHVRVNRAVLRAARLAGVPYFAITAAVEATPSTPDSDRIEIDGSAVFDRKVEALESYRSQVAVVETADGPALRYPHGAVEKISVIETFRHVPEPVVAQPAFGVSDLGEFSAAGRAVTYLLALVVGGVFGALGTVAHQDLLGSFPLGAVLALALVAALIAGFRLLFESRMVGIVAALGVVLMIFVLSLPSSGGSVLIPANSAAALAWTFGSPVIAVVLLAWPRLPQSRRDRSPESAR